MDPQVRSIQPGGGACMRLELTWGRFRRWYLKRFRRRYVERIAEVRRGGQNACPHEVLDPRDVKFFRNQDGFSWNPEDDPFAWRDRLPVVRVGLAELIVLGGTCLVLTAGLATAYWPACWVPALLGLFILWFFRDPRRNVPAEPGQIVAPADGKVVQVENLPHDAYIGGPAIQIGIFLSVFNVHVNRSPSAARVIGLTYQRGKFLNALRSVSARENEQMIVRLEDDHFPHRRFIVRQIAGAIARRIVCWIAPGESLERGERFGMIKLGSRTELVMPDDPTLTLLVSPGDHVRAGSTVMARYEDTRQLREDHRE
jgi:phosphatidylserine decarboxylase